MGKRQKQVVRAALCFLAPSLTGIGILVLIPFLHTLRRSFYNDPGTRFLGLENYRSVLNNAAFQLAAVNTGKLMLISIHMLLAISLILALLVQSMGQRGQVFRTSFLFPLAIPVASASLLRKLWRMPGRSFNGRNRPMRTPRPGPAGRWNPTKRRQASCSWTWI